MASVVHSSAVSPVEDTPVKSTISWVAVPFLPRHIVIEPYRPAGCHSRKEPLMGSENVRTYYEDGEWKSKVEGSSRAAHVGGTKAEQEAVGRAMAQARHSEHTISNMNGEIGKKNSYGNDPHPPKG